MEEKKESVTFLCADFNPDREAWRLAAEQAAALPSLEDEDLITRLKVRASIRRQIVTRKSVQEGKPDRISDLLEEAAAELKVVYEVLDHIHSMSRANVDVVVIEKLIDEDKARRSQR